MEIGRDQSETKETVSQVVGVEHLYLYRRVCVCLSVCVCVSFRRYTRRRLWSDRDQILHIHADSSTKGSEVNKNQPRVTKGGLGGF